MPTYIDGKTGNISVADLVEELGGAIYSGVLPAVSSYTYNADGTVATETVSGIITTYGYNADGTVNTMTRSGTTRTFTYNADGTIGSVA